MLGNISSPERRESEVQRVNNLNDIFQRVSVGKLRLFGSSHENDWTASLSGKHWTWLRMSSSSHVTILVRTIKNPGRSFNDARWHDIEIVDRCRRWNLTLRCSEKIQDASAAVIPHAEHLQQTSSISFDWKYPRCESDGMFCIEELSSCYLILINIKKKKSSEYWMSASLEKTGKLPESHFLTEFTIRWSELAVLCDFHNTNESVYGWTMWFCSSRSTCNSLAGQPVKIHSTATRLLVWCLKLRYSATCRPVCLSVCACLSVHGDLSQAHLIQQVIAGREPDVAVTPAANHVQRFKSRSVVVGELDRGQKSPQHAVPKLHVLLSEYWANTVHVTFIVSNCVP